MAHFEELNDINFYIKKTLLDDGDLKKLLFYPEEDALKPSNPIPDDDQIWKVHMFPMERYVDATTDDKTYLNYFYNMGRNYSSNNSFAYIDIVFDIIIYLDSDEINEGLRRISILNLIDTKFNEKDLGIGLMDKSYLQGWSERNYSKNHYGIRTTYRISLNSNITCINGN